MGGDLLKKCIVQSIGFAMTVDMIVYAIWQPNAKTCAILGLIYFALYLALSYVYLNHSKPRKGISISNYVNTFFDFKYIV